MRCLYHSQSREVIRSRYRLHHQGRQALSSSLSLPTWTRSPGPLWLSENLRASDLAESSEGDRMGGGGGETGRGGTAGPVSMFLIQTERWWSSLADTVRSSPAAAGGEVR